MIYNCHLEYDICEKRLTATTEDCSLFIYNELYNQQWQTEEERPLALLPYTIITSG